MNTHRIKLKKYINLALNVQKAALKKEIVLIISHMRARTTLLSHILGSNQEICGHHELHIQYRGFRDYLGLKSNLLNEENYTASRYILDKILHNHLDTSRDFLITYKPKVIIVTRPPEETVKSIINMYIRTNQKYTTKDVIDYYRSRLEHISDFSGMYTNNYYYLESDSLVSATSDTLRNIGDFLSLRHPLTENYNIFRGTGEPGKGDMSNNITSGKILRKDTTKNSTILTNINFDDLNSLYNKCRLLIREGSINNASL